jgi:hypothetical protein
VSQYPTAEIVAWRRIQNAIACVNSKAGASENKFIWYSEMVVGEAGVAYRVW